MKKVYKKPEVKVVKNNTLVLKQIDRHPGKIACRQCSSCHGCR